MVALPYKLAAYPKHLRNIVKIESIKYVKYRICYGEVTYL